VKSYEREKLRVSNIGRLHVKPTLVSWVGPRFILRVGVPSDKVPSIHNF